MSNLDKESPVTETAKNNETKVVAANTVFDNIPIVKDSPPFPDNIPVRYDGGKAPVGA